MTVSVHRERGRPACGSTGAAAKGRTPYDGVRPISGETEVRVG
jgi:hypothetical protein